jgi:DNA repair exonuclease SbcCD nuclease subunit
VTKIMGSGDNHFDIHSRFAECVRIHDWIAERVEAEQPDIFVDGGDLYERASTPEERRAGADWLQRIANVCPVVVTKGNHDRRLDCALLAKLSARHPIIVEEAAAVHYVRGVAIACMAWPERAGILALAAKHGADADAIERDALQAVLRGLGDELAKHNGPKLALGHFMVDGSETSTGQPLVGMSMNVGLTELALLNAPVVLMSHIHLGQEWTLGAMVAHYMGSPYRTSYGETERKSISVVTFDGPRCVGVERIDTPCTPMLHVRGAWVWENYDDTPAFTPHLVTDIDKVASNIAGADIRIRYVVEPEHRDAAKADAERLRDALITQGATAVKLEAEIITTTRSRAPDLATAATLVDRLDAYWKAKDSTPEQERRQRLLSKVALLEGGVS